MEYQTISTGIYPSCIDPVTIQSINYSVQYRKTNEIPVEFMRRVFGVMNTSFYFRLVKLCQHLIWSEKLQFLPRWMFSLEQAAKALEFYFTDISLHKFLKIFPHEAANSFQGKLDEWLASWPVIG